LKKSKGQRSDSESRIITKKRRSKNLASEISSKVINRDSSSKKGKQQKSRELLRRNEPLSELKTNDNEAVDDSRFFDGFMDQCNGRKDQRGNILSDAIKKVLGNTASTNFTFQ
jgi:hypothetical protein